MERETNPDELAQQYGSYPYPPVRGPPPRHVVQQQMSAVRSPEGYRQSTGRQSIRRNQMQPQGGSSGRRGGATRDSRIHRSSDTTAAASHLLNREQNVAFQFQQHPLSPQSVRHAQPRQVDFSAALQPAAAAITSSTALQSALGQQQVYDMGLMFGFAQPGTAQMPYGMSSQQSLGGAAPGDGGARFGVPQQYLPLADDPESLSRYLSAQGQLAAAAPYPQQQQHPRILADQEMHPNTLSSFNLTTGSRDMQQQQAAVAAENSANFENAYHSFQQTLITVFGYTQRGFLNEASRLLLGLSQWLRENARDLGLFRDDSNTITKHKQLWHEFNICWLALCQKQKDLTESLLRSAHHRQRPLQQVLPATVLTSDSLETMAEEIIRFCDVLEPYGLVDYEIGLWEEEILDIIGQCLDLIGS